ncbi:MAG TPA: hypothetical protein VN285_06705 [Candidatus Deferrimicrobium sp.]|nr:hypothetical protein [Candidatus Deferrimicrobium sp.]
MKTVGKAISVALLVVALSGSGEPGERDGIVDAFLLFHELELVSYHPDAPSTFKLFYGPGVPCGDKVSAIVSRRDYAQKFSEQTCQLELRSSRGGLSSYTTSFEMFIPNNDTTQLCITLQCDTFAYAFKHFFVTTGDTVEYRRVDPRELPPPPRPAETDDPILDTLTEEQLQKEYEVLLDLRESSRRMTSENLLGTIPESSKSSLCDACYILSVSLENLFRLAEAGVEFEFTTPPPWAPESSSPEDSVPQSSPPSTTEANQIDVDTLTSEQLLSEHEVLLWFRDSTERKAIEVIVGPLPDSAKLRGPWGLYRLKMSLEKFIQLKNLKVDAHFATPLRED